MMSENISGFARFWIFLFFSIVLNIEALRAQTAIHRDTVTQMTLDWVIDQAIRNNPELAAFERTRSAAAARIPQMGSLDDPTFNVKIMEAPQADVLNSSKWKYANFEFMQMIPFPGKLSKKETIATIMAEHAHHDYQEKLLDVIDRAKIAFFDLYFIQRALDINLENVNLLNQFVKSAQTRYAVGTVANQDLLKANVELAKLANEQITLEQKEETAKAMLNTLLNRLPQAPLGRTILNEETSEEYDVEKLQQLALQNRPMVRHDSLSIVQTQVSLALAKQQYLPDFRVSLEYVTSPLDGFRGWTGMVGLSIPFSPWTLGKRSGEIQEAEANQQVNEAIYQNTRNMVLFSVKDALVKLVTARRLVNLYRETVLPQSTQSLQATFVAYQTKQTDFLTLLDSQRSLKMFQIEYYQAFADYGKSLSELERAVGWRLIQEREHSPHIR
ncbi:MAG: TolC family protein [Ignavibacteriales bacterium]|nr:TolC family protein [Ignavibacteriales bacterium]